jgi:hypothetical protein
MTSCFCFNAEFFYTKKRYLIQFIVQTCNFSWVGAFGPLSSVLVFGSKNIEVKLELSPNFLQYMPCIIKPEGASSVWEMDSYFSKAQSETTACVRMQHRTVPHQDYRNAT